MICLCFSCFSGVYVLLVWGAFNQCQLTSFGKGLDFELFNCFCKRFFFLLLAPGSALEKFAAIVKPENKPTRVNWTLSRPSALEICGKTVL